MRKHDHGISASAQERNSREVRWRWQQELFPLSAMFLRSATALLSLSGDDTLFAEAQARAQMIVEALPDEYLIRAFLTAEPVCSLMPRKH